MCQAATRVDYQGSFNTKFNCVAWCAVHLSRNHGKTGFVLCRARHPDGLHPHKLHVGP